MKHLSPILLTLMLGLAACTGPAGPRGYTGNQGNTGYTGQQGETGHTGAQGKTGSGHPTTVIVQP